MHHVRPIDESCHYMSHVTEAGLERIRHARLMNGPWHTEEGDTSHA